MKKGIFVCIIGEVVTTIGMIVLGVMERPIPEFVTVAYGLFMLVAFGLIIAKILRSHKSTGGKKG